MKRFCKTPIAVFDSGVGGLSVLKELEKLMPAEHYVYFADTKNLPYGNKTAEDIIDFNRNIIDFLLLKGVRDVVMACNTSSAISYDILCREFPHVKFYPLIQTVAQPISKFNTIGVLATEATVNTGKYSKEIKKYNKNAEVFEVACDGFVEIVENKLYDMPSTLELVDLKLENLPEADKIVLGCTHYPYLLDIFEKFIPREFFIDPAKLFAEAIAKEFKKRDTEPIFELGKKEFFINTKDKEKFIQNAKIFYDIEGNVECV